MDLYAQNILDRYKHPFYKDKTLVPTCSHLEANHSCGDKVEVKVIFTNEKASSYSFSGVGCAISMASADMLGDVVQGLSADQVLKLSKDSIYEVLGIEISERRSKCALLSLMALQNAILGLRGEPLRSWPDYFADSFVL